MQQFVKSDENETKEVINRNVAIQRYGVKVERILDDLVPTDFSIGVMKLKLYYVRDIEKVLKNYTE
jgi:hypothetical protein